MDLAHLIWLNQAVQLVVVVSGVAWIRWKTGFLGLEQIFAVGDHHGGGWQADPLTQAVTKLEAIETEMEDLKKNYVTRAEFDPVKRVVYGMVAIILTTAFGSMIALVMKTSGGKVGP